jgi:hypothetical protein
MRAGSRAWIFLVIGFLLSGLAAADITRTGEIVGTIKGEDGAPLPGATVKITSDALIQKEITQTTDARGTFRFNNLNPGAYTVSISLDRFRSKEVAVTVNVGRTSTLDEALALAGTAEEVVVRGEAPLIDKTTPALQTNYTAKELAQIPSNRTYIDVVDTAPGLDNRMAFGAGGNVDGYDAFGFGAATNQYLLNGVGTSNLQFGNTWVNPNYDTVQEVQIVGAGASAEYANFTGATINVITKAGTNDFHGGATVYGTSSALQSDNSGGIVDLEQPDTKYRVESNAYIGGPIIKEKLLFFASGNYNTASYAPIQTDFFGQDTRPGAQIRFDFLANSQNTMSAMYDYEPIKLTDQGLQPTTGPEVGFFRQEHVNTGYFSWVSTWNRNTLTELKYGAGEGYLGRIPNNTTDIGVYDVGTGLFYNSQGFSRTQRNWRQEGRGSVTHYLDQFLNGNHELKAGVEYEWQRGKQDFVSNQNTQLYLIPVGGGLTYVAGQTGYNYHINSEFKRVGVYVQDKANWDRFTANIGFRYDNPKTIDGNDGKTLLNFDNFSPRIALTYDVSGKGDTIVGASYGRYYDKVPTYGPASYAGTGHDITTNYGTVTDQVFDPRDPNAIRDFIIQPQYITSVFDSLAIPVVDGTKNPHSDVVSARAEHQFGPQVAVSLNYLYRYTKDYVSLVQYANNVTYEPFQYTSPFTNNTFTYYTVTGGGPRQFALGNMDFWYQRGHELILEMRARPNTKSFVNASITWDHYTGTRDNNECGVLTLCTNGVDTDPNYELNPYYTQGVLSQNRPFNFKILGSYQLPFGITTSADFRWFSGRAYGAIAYNYTLGDPRFNDPYAAAVHLEPKDARKEANAVLLNLRIQKDFFFSGGVQLSLIVDLLNATNEAIDFNTNIQNDINATYPRQSTLEGQTVSAFGQPYSLTEPRQARFGLRVAF